MSKSSLVATHLRSLASVALLALTGCAGAPTPPGRPPIPLAKGAFAELSRGPCYGNCPVYSVSIHEDGTVDYHGSEAVKTEGDAQYQLPLARVAQLRKAFRKADYWALADKYTTQDLTDSSTASTAYAEDGRVKRIEHYYGDNSAPKVLLELEYEVDRLAETERMIGTAEERSGLGHFVH